MGRHSALVSLLSLVCGGFLVVALQWLAGGYRPVVHGASRRGGRESLGSHHGGLRDGALSDFEAADEWFRELREINRHLKDPPPQKRDLGASRMLPGFGKDALESRLESDTTKGRVRSGPLLSCQQFRSSNFSWPDGIKSIAVVGNGPLKPESRREINSMDFVIRFNKLQSFKCGDKFDVWASRHGDAVTTRYWGIGQTLNVPNCPTNVLLKQAKHIWLMNGGDGPFNHFINSFPQIREKANYLWLDCRLWVLQYLERHDPKLLLHIGASTQDEVSPSSGWLVLMMVADCAPRDVAVHVYGFNWPGGQWPAHKVEGEKAEIHRMQELGLLTVHDTACKASRIYMHIFQSSLGQTRPRLAMVSLKEVGG